MDDDDECLIVGDMALFFCGTFYFHDAKVSVVDRLSG